MYQASYANSGMISRKYFARTPNTEHQKAKEKVGVCFVGLDVLVRVFRFSNCMSIAQDLVRRTTSKQGQSHNSRPLYDALVCLEISPLFLRRGVEANSHIDGAGFLELYLC